MELVSQLLERNASIFENQKVIACGFFADEYIIDLAEKTSHMTIWLTDYNQFCSLARKLSIDFDPKVINLGSLLSSQDQKITLLFSEVLEKVSSDYTMGLLVISKNKNENKWYLHQLIKHTNTDAQIYTAGPNERGIRGMETVLKTLGHVSREDNARKCLLLRECRREARSSPLPVSFAMRWRLVSTSFMQNRMDRGNSGSNTRNSDTFCGVTSEYFFRNISKALTLLRRAVHCTESSAMPTIEGVGSSRKYLTSRMREV